MIDPEICFHCVNNLRDKCVECTHEGRFRFLEPIPPKYGEMLPELPAMREVVDMPPYHRLALLWLHIRLREIKETVVY